MAFEKIYKTFRIRWKIRAISLEDEFSSELPGREYGSIKCMAFVLFDRSI